MAFALDYPCVICRLALLCFKFHVAARGCLLQVASHGSRRGVCLHAHSRPCFASLLAGEPPAQGLHDGRGAAHVHATGQYSKPMSLRQGERIAPDVARLGGEPENPGGRARIAPDGPDCGPIEFHVTKLGSPFTGHLRHQHGVTVSGGRRLDSLHCHHGYTM